MLFPRGESRSEVLESGTADLDLSDDFFRVLDMVHFHDSDESPFSRGLSHNGERMFACQVGDFEGLMPGWLMIEFHVQQ